MRVPTSMGQAATHGGTNAAVALLLGGYLATALYQGNLGALASQAKQDLIGGNGERGFWQWAVAVLILVWLSQTDKGKAVFGPLLGIALVAMLINLAVNQPSSFANLTGGIKSFFSPNAASVTTTSPKATTTTGTGASSSSGSGTGGMFGGLLGGGSSGGGGSSLLGMFGGGGSSGGFLGGNDSSGSGASLMGIFGGSGSGTSGAALN